MAKAEKKKAPKKRADKYEEKLLFNGTLDDLVKLTVKHAEKKKEDKNKAS